MASDAVGNSLKVGMSARESRACARLTLTLALSHQGEGIRWLGFGVGFKWLV